MMPNAQQSATIVDPFPALFQKIEELTEGLVLLNERIERIENEGGGKKHDFKRARRAIGAAEYERMTASGDLTREHIKVLRRACHLFDGTPYRNEPVDVRTDEEGALWKDLIAWEMGRRVPSPKGAKVPYCVPTDLGKNIVRHDVHLRGK